MAAREAATDVAPTTMTMMTIADVVADEGGETAGAATKAVAAVVAAVAETMMTNSFRPRCCGSRTAARRS
jgi:hypothetical protein